MSDLEKVLEQMVIEYWSKFLEEAELSNIPDYDLDYDQFEEEGMD